MDSQRVRVSTQIAYHNSAIEFATNRTRCASLQRYSCVPFPIEGLPYGNSLDIHRSPGSETARRPCAARHAGISALRLWSKREIQYTTRMSYVCGGGLLMHKTLLKGKKLPCHRGHEACEHAWDLGARGLYSIVT